MILNASHRRCSKTIGIAGLIFASLVGWADDKPTAEWDALVACRKLHRESKAVQTIPTLRKLSESRDASLRHEALFLLGRSFEAASKPKDALRAWDRLVGDQPKPEWLCRGNRARGDLLNTAGETVKAMAAYGDSLAAPEERACSEKVLAAASLGDLHAAKEEKEKAAEMYKFALKVADGLYDIDKAGLDLAGIRSRLDGLGREKRVETSGEARVLFEEAERLRTASKFDAALAKYREVLSRFPEASEAVPSKLHEGTCLFAQQKYDEAERVWTPFTQSEPKGPWRGGAWIALTDLFLEIRLNPVKAAECLTKFGEGVGAGVVGWEEYRDVAEFRRAAVAYIRGDKKAVLAALDAARAFRPASDAYKEQGAPTLLERFITKLRRGEEITPPEVRKGRSGPAAVAVVLGDLYYSSRELPKAQSLYARLNSPPREVTAGALLAITKDGKKPDKKDWLKHYESLSRRNGGGKDPMPDATDLQCAWARLREGVCRYEQFDFPGAMGCFGEFLTAYDKTPYAPEAHLRAGIILAQLLPEDHQLEEAIYENLTSRYPDADQAPTSVYYHALIAYYAGRRPEALQRLGAAYQRYPSESMRKAVAFWTDRIRKESRSGEGEQ